MRRAPERLDRDSVQDGRGTGARAGESSDGDSAIEQGWLLLLRARVARAAEEIRWDGARVVSAFRPAPPGRGESRCVAERRRFVTDDRAARLLASYAEHFGEPPPVDIWPNSERRFDPSVRWVRVDLAAHWMLPKPRAVLRLCAGWSAGRVDTLRRGPAPGRRRGSLRWVALVLACVVASLLVTVALSDGVTGPSFLLLQASVWALTVAAAFALRRRTRRVPDGAVVPELDAYDAAHLARAARGWP
jgi:hypothetical protein